MQAGRDTAYTQRQVARTVLRGGGDGSGGAGARGPSAGVLGRLMRLPSGGHTALAWRVSLYRPGEVTRNAGRDYPGSVPVKNCGM